MTEAAQVSTGLEIYGYATFAYVAAFLVYAIHAVYLRKKVVGTVATVFLLAAWGMHTVFLVKRSMFYYQQYQGFVLPSSNMFEVISYFAWMIVLLYLIAEIFFLKTRVFGVFILLIPLAAMIYTTRVMFLDPAAAEPREFMPALKSYWMPIHVSAMIISYSAFALAFIFAVLYILRARGVKVLERIDPRYNLKFLDYAMFRIVLFAFPILTLGVFLGAVWADSSWGRYWGWDPKEVWALITWLVYLGFLHLRIQWNFIGYRSALLSIVGFSCVMMTFQGVNLLDSAFGLSSLHAYAEGGATLMLAVLGLALLIPIVLFFLPMPKEDISHLDAYDDSLLPEPPATTAKEEPGLQTPDSGLRTR